MNNDERLARIGLSGLRNRGEQLDQDELRKDPTAYWQELVATSTRAAAIDPEQLQRAAESADVRFIAPGDDEWPAEFEHLNQLGSPFDEEIVGLWVAGAPLNKHERPVALLSSQVATASTESVFGELARGISRTGRSIITSGTADVDVAVLRGAKRSRGSVLAVLPTALDQVRNREFTRQLSDSLDDGATAISEAPPGCDTYFYPRVSERIYRIILALADVFIASDIESGWAAQNMVVTAHRLGRRTFAAPGHINYLISAGANELIRDGHAEMLLATHTIKSLLD